MGLQLQFGFSGEGGVDEGDTSTGVDKERGTAAVDSMSETNCITWVVTTLACLFAELLAEPAGAAIC